MARRSTRPEGAVTHREMKKVGAGGGRERLLRAAVRQFASRGYHATSVRDVVRAAGVTAPSLYHHFGNKEGLFLAILRASQERGAAAQQAVRASGGSAAARILRLARTYVGLRREFADLGWAVLRILAGPRRSAPRIDFRVYVLEKTRHFQELVEEGVASGEFRPCVPRHVALALMGAVEFASRPPVIAARVGRSSEALAGMVGVILSGIAARPVRRSTRRGATGGPPAARRRTAQTHGERHARS